ncbi:site-specific integrase [Salmonella enterica]|nr:site-specific integrase [Salmonella enterica]EEP3372979.1 site-specific integrase [Salmonella enterica]EFP6579686.1 site-specific integrase [Salmonella enterica]EGC7970968.1 site-specific integrase [Salmonella enterica]EIV4461151.1 site-specific integrase [Salmonella enterica]
MSENFPVVRKRTVKLMDALDKYVDTVSSEKSGWQQESYRRNIIKKYAISSKYMHEITAVDIAEYRDERLATINSRTGKSISGNTVRLELALLSALFNLAIAEWGTCTINPVKLVRKPKCNPGRERRLHAHEEKKLRKYFKDKNFEIYVIFLFALETGMRQGEILSLVWENVNLQAGVAHLPVTKNGSFRDVPLSLKARQLLTQMNVKPSGKVFGYSSSGLKSAWRNALLFLKIEDLHFHDLRHEAISRFFELGTLNVMEVAAISGHKSLTMLKRYTHLRAYQLVKKLDSKKKSISKIASYFVPYPAVHRKEIDGRHCVELIDFSAIKVQRETLELAITDAGFLLLKELALAAQNGKRIPVPGEFSAITKDMLIINPLQ